MQKKLVLLVALMATTANAHAIEITNGKLISERTISNNVKVISQPLTITTQLKNKVQRANMLS